jgi:hypothetical protein
LIVTTDDKHYGDIADAIRAKLGTTDRYKPEDMAAAVGDIESGGGEAIPSASPKEVNFYDYDGKLLYSYTLAEAQSLAALPAAPDHSSDTIPLTFQGWNYTLAQVNALTDKANIGATYIPTDGKTHLTINIAEYGRQVVPLYFNQTVSNGVTIDWGDGSLPETFTGTGNINTTHTYSAAGTYDITLDVTSGVLRFGANSSSYCVLGSTGDNGKVYCNMLKSVRIGNSVTTIDTYAFDSCYSLASVTIPNGVTTMGTYAFRYCYALASVTIPNGVTTMGTNAFRYCYALASVTIPNGVTTMGTHAFRFCYALASVTIPNGVTRIDAYAFDSCHSLASVTIPNSVTTIGDYAFRYCYGMAIYDFSTHTSVPTLASTNAFDGIPSDCIMKIPSALFATWENETNWSTYASQMVAV